MKELFWVMSSIDWPKSFSNEEDVKEYIRDLVESEDVNEDEIYLIKGSRLPVTITKPQLGEVSF